ncbi:MAG: BrnT family toxin [Candidatus Competibacteraceae bacterium]|nr:BrnT family toxin [Candidatus Competibacteraceae bacterium]
MDITYDPAKNARNIAERGLSFDRAADLVWADAVAWEDQRKTYPEHRFVAVGYLDARLHVLCFAETATGIRVISFRKANTREARSHGKPLTLDR